MVDEGAGGASEHTDSVTPHITDAACTYASNVYTLTPNKAAGDTNYFCLRFKAPNNYVTSASFKIGTKTYTAVNAAFKQNDIVILNFDVSQSKCFFVSGGVGKNVKGQEFTYYDTSLNQVTATALQGAEIFNDYDHNKAIGKYSTAMGEQTAALGSCATAMGENTTAGGKYSTSIGYLTDAMGICSVAMGHATKAKDYNTVIGALNKEPREADLHNKTGDLFVIGNSGDPTIKSNAFRVTCAGDVMGTKSYSASGADYAEMFEWTDRKSVV